MADRQGSYAVNAAVNQLGRPIGPELSYHLPRWMIAFVLITLIQELLVFEQTSKNWWYVPTLASIGLAEGAFGGLMFVFLQRFWNLKGSRVVRLRNYLAATIITGITSLLVMTEIYR